MQSNTRFFLSRNHSSAARVYLRRRTVAVFFSALLTGAVFLSAPGTLQAAEKSVPQSAGGKYLGKDYIDTTVQRAIFIINEAADVAGVGFRQKEAIGQAKAISLRLKAEVQGDPNERYALWKIGELDWLIYLEEKDLVLQKVKIRLVTVRQTVADYNKELGKARPDFKTLVRLHAQMGDLDARRANEMAGSIEKRSRIVSREAMVALEKALMCGNLTQSNEEFKYCLRNRQYLALPADKFNRLESRVSACMRSREELPLVRSEAENASALVAKNRLGEARSAAAGAKYRLIDIRSCVPDQAAREIMMRLNQIERLLDHREDSLVCVNITILNTKGVNAANEYLESVLRPAGVSHEKAARVDNAILAVAPSPDSRSENSRVTKVIDAVASSAEESGTDVFAEMRRKAKIRAQFRLDSIQIEEAERARIVQWRLDSIDAQARKEAEHEFQKNQEAAKAMASDIYALIQKDKAKAAHGLFIKQQPSLFQYLPPDAFAMLEATVRQAIDPKWSGESTEIAYLSTTESAEQQPAAPKNLTAAGKNDPNRERAAVIIAAVYDMLERNDAKGAFKSFDREKSFLKKHLEKDMYDILNTTVTQAYKK